MSLALQTIIGTDKNNPHFTICRNADNNDLYIYHGNALHEVISSNCEKASIKHLVARLYNTKVKLKSLSEHFGYSQKTIKKWGDMLRAGKLPKLINIWSDSNANLKLTKEIKSFVIHQFKHIYPTDKYTYSKKIRTNIEDVFKIKISSETLRPLFNEQKLIYKKKL